MSKYTTLIKILDELRNEAPDTYKRYHPDETDVDKLNQARARAFIHLFLKGNYGLTDFYEREKYITDDAGDGGIDAYFIDTEHKTIIFIQSKFRATAENFENKEITYEELLSMDISRILEGENQDVDGNSYNDKIRNMQSCISNTEGIARYNYKVIIFANLQGCKNAHLKKLTDGFPAVVYDHEKCYKELVFPVVAGCLYKAEEISISLSLANVEGNDGRITYMVNTELGDCKILVTFVPLIEIAKAMYKYKNSILKYNPRCYLGLNNNEVNPKIMRTVINRNTNEFALYNNGITILSDDTNINSRIGVRDRAQLIITNPQIINGGQTSYTLASIYETALTSNDFSNFENKEVLVKVITFISQEEEDGTEGIIPLEKKLSLIEELSRATNEQSEVSEVDRHSNDRILIDYQMAIYDKFGLFLNRKDGEFYDGLNKKYISEDQIIDLSMFMRIALSICGDPKKARRCSDEVLVKDEFAKLFFSTDECNKYVFGYFCYTYLQELEKDSNFENANVGNALRYGKYAVVSVVSRAFNPEIKLQSYQEKAKEKTIQVLTYWNDFENYVTKKKENDIYFYTTIENGIKQVFHNFDGYYKGRTINKDLIEFNFAL